MLVQTLDHPPLKDNQNLVCFPQLKYPKRERTHSLSCHKKLHMPVVPHENDILLGRGGKNNMHTGNEKFRQLARTVADRYHRSSKKEKSNLSRQLIQRVRDMQPQGRFLRRTRDGKNWEDVSHDDERCREKAAQVLRDAVSYVGLKETVAPTERRESFSSQSFPMPRHSNPQMDPTRMSFRRDSFSAMSSMDPAVPFAMRRSNNPMVGYGNSGPARQAPFPNINLYNVARRIPFPGQSTDRYGQQPVPISPSYTAPSSMSHTMPPQQGESRPPKRRRMSNFFERYASVLPEPYYDRRDSLGHPQPVQPTPPVQQQQYASLPPTAEIHNYGRRISASNSHPAVSDQRYSLPGPRLAATRKDSLLGSLSLSGEGSGHSISSAKEFELFPDINDQNDCSNDNEDEGDEFSSDFV